MSDMATAGGGPIEVEIAGRKVKMAELSFNDRRDLLREHRKAERQSLKELLSETQMPPEQQYMELRTFDSESVGGRVWAQYFNSTEGQAKILVRSLEKCQQGQGQQLADQIDWGDDEVLNKCAYVCHVTLIPLSKSQGDAANPQTALPLGYGQ